MDAVKIERDKNLQGNWKNFKRLICTQIKVDLLCVMKIEIINAASIPATKIFIFFLTFLKKRRHTFLSKNGVTPERADQGVEDRLDQDSIYALDSKIRDELDKYGK